MWVFYLISLPLTLGMVMVTLGYFAGPDVPRYVLFTVGYTWFCSLSFIILVPADIWTTMARQDKAGITFFWSWSYWSTFALTWAVVPAIQGYEDAGDFTMKERLKTSFHVNLVFYLIVGSIGLLGLLLLIIMHGNWSVDFVALAMACSNTFGLVTGAFLLGFGLSEIPKSIWRNADWGNRQKFLSHRVAKMAVKLDDAHKEFSNAIVVAQATSKQMSKRDPLRPYMNVIDNMLVQMFREDPSFKPSGGRLGENDMDYDTDEKTMATLRRQLKRAHEEYYRYKSEYLTYVMEALELEDTIKNFDCRDSTGCFMLLQIAAFVPLMYMCICTYYSLFKIGMLMFYSFTPRQTSSVSLLMICSMVARYAPPISYNFLNLIRLDGDDKTVFEKRMGNIDDAVPFFGKGFNNIYPLIMVIYTALVASNFFGRVIDLFGSWKMFKIQNEEADMNGFDSSGIIILQKERSWLEQGHKLGEQVIPLARNFNNMSVDLESSMSQDKGTTERTGTGRLSKEDTKRNLTTQKEKNELYSREALANKYAALREKLGRPSSFARSSKEKGVPSTSVSLLHPDNNQNHSDGNAVASGLSSKWASMKSGLQNFKANIEAKKFFPLRHIQQSSLHSQTSSSEFLDEVFRRLKQSPSRDQNGDFSYEDGDGLDIIGSGPSR
ncbi:LMBR1 domain-containing protein 2 homolog [Dendrobium catenatum]|nr:LMBR1 domain-containing protein 2 homolog [Dendrobium catenatum]